MRAAASRRFATAAWAWRASCATSAARGGSTSRRSVCPWRCGRAAAGPPGGAHALDALEHAAADEDALQVRRRDVMPERRDVDLPQLGDRELPRREREADVRVRELGPQARLCLRDELAGARLP